MLMNRKKVWESYFPDVRLRRDQFPANTCCTFSLKLSIGNS